MITKASTAALDRSTKDGPSPSVAHRATRLAARSLCYCLATGYFGLAGIPL